MVHGKLFGFFVRNYSYYFFHPALAGMACMTISKYCSICMVCLISFILNFQTNFLPTIPI
jgi:hypothetical protein